MRLISLILVTWPSTCPLLLGSHPRGGGFGLPVWEQIDNLVGVQVHHNRAKGSAAPKREVVEAKALHMLGFWSGQCYDSVHDRHPRRGNSQMRGQARAKLATRC